MDFHAEFDKSFERFPGLEGLIFVDEDGEAVLFKSRGLDPYDVQLAGARVPILQQHYKLGPGKRPKFTEMIFGKRYVLSILLKQCYSITAIGRGLKERAHLSLHLHDMARKFNEEIV